MGTDFERISLLKIDKEVDHELKVEDLEEVKDEHPDFITTRVVCVSQW